MKAKKCVKAWKNKAGTRWKQGNKDKKAVKSVKGRQAGNEAAVTSKKKMKK